MTQKTKPIEHYQTYRIYAEWLLRKLQSRGVLFTIAGNDALHVKGEMTATQKETVRLWKRQLIEALSPKCENCALPMRLIEENTFWFCPLGCSKQGVKDVI